MINTIHYNTIQYNTIQYNTIQYKKIKLASPLHITMISEAQKFIRKTEKDRVQLVSLFLGSTQILLYTQVHTHLQQKIVVVVIIII
jgi:hypothetical protein